MTSLIDPFGRQIEYLRLSVTDRCDLRCFYCLPKGFKDFHTPDHWLNFEEIERIVRAFAELGLKRLRITGGEPLLRKQLPQLAAQLSGIPNIEDLSLSTNAIQLGKQAAALHAANISRINVSLDSLNTQRFREITNGGKLDKVINSLMVAKHVGFSPIKINMVVMKGVNDNEVEDMLRFCLEHDFTLRFIETMPIGDTGRNAQDHFMDLRIVRERLERKFNLIPGVMPGGGPARYVQVAGSKLRIGFITPLSQHFCETCNRVRLSVDGQLYLCLGQHDKVDLRTPLRQGISDDELRELVQHAITLKPERHEFNENPQQIVRFMADTGG